MSQQNFFWQIQAGELPPPPAAKTLGIRFMQIDAEAGTIETEFQARQEFTNPAGNIQGGFLAAMLDDSMGPALAATLAVGEFAPTLNLNVSYLRAAKVGLIQGKACVVKRGKDICFLAGELYQDGHLIATATATAMVRNMVVQA